MARYEFVTVWRIAGPPLEAVWEAIYHSERWPSWWKGVEAAVPLEPAGADGVSPFMRYTFKSALPYRLTFDMRRTRLEPPHVLEGHAVGELEGVGLWQLSQEGEITRVQYDWKVRTTKAWLNAIAPLARPLLVWNHDYVMNEGGRALAKLLNARLVSLSEE